MKNQLNLEVGIALGKIESARCKVSKFMLAEETDDITGFKKSRVPVDISNAVRNDLLYEIKNAENDIKTALAEYNEYIKNFL